MTALRAELQATIDAAAAGERQVLTTCAESDLLAGGVLFGVGRRMPAAAPTPMTCGRWPSVCSAASSRADRWRMC